MTQLSGKIDTSKPMNGLSKMLRIKNIAMIIAAVAIAACTGSEGDKFVGKWVNVGNPDITLEIEKDSGGKTFTVTDRMTWMQKPHVTKHTATVEDNSLLLKTDIGKLPMFIDKNGILQAGMGRSCPNCDQWERAK
jgi:hypothetical protein